MFGMGFCRVNKYVFISVMFTSVHLARVLSTMYIQLVAGTGSPGFGGDNGPATSAAFNFNYGGLWGDSLGNLYIGDGINHRLRKIDPTGTITTIAGTASSSTSGASGPGTSTSVSSPWFVAGDTLGSFIYFSDQKYVWKYQLSNGFLSRYGGAPSGSYVDNVPATSTTFNEPRGLWMTTTGFLYIIDRSNSKIRVIDPSGIVTLVAGGGASGANGVPATTASLNNPTGIFVDTVGAIFFTDSNNFQIRKIISGIISTFYSSGLAWPYDVKGDSIGNIFIADSGNHRVKKVDTLGILSNYVGTGTIGLTLSFTVASSALVEASYGMWVDTSGNLFMCETNNVIHKTVIPVPTALPTICPTAIPTQTPSRQPTMPTSVPTNHPSSNPSTQPSSHPSTQPFVSPTARPSNHPTIHPSTQPSVSPTGQPSSLPSGQPSTRPSRQPTAVPSGGPTVWPTCIPTQQPTSQPSSLPTGCPSRRPSSFPTIGPTRQPSGIPSAQPSGVPSGQPTAVPSFQPTNIPSGQPTSPPSDQPSSLPSAFPSGWPSSVPSNQPTDFPTNRPTCVPTSQPSGFPSSLPSSRPSVQPISAPSSFPTLNPTFQPTIDLATNLKQDIVGFYNVKASLNDKSGNGNNGKAHGGVSFASDRFGFEKSSIHFDGNSGYIEVPTRNSDQLITNFTLSFWIYPNISRLAPGTVVFDRSAYLSETCGWSLIYVKDHLFEFSYNVQHSGRRLAVSNFSSSVLFNVQGNYWSHIAIVKELQTMFIYKDIHLVNSTNIPSSVSLPYSSLPLVIGTSREVLLHPENTGNLSYFSGGLDDILIYNRALSVEEVKSGKELSAPTSSPSAQPSSKPSAQPTVAPSMRPTVQPTSSPSSLPTGKPSGLPSQQPTASPSGVPSNQPTSFPSSNPTNRPTSLPSNPPTTQPSGQPAGFPTTQPSSKPSRGPTACPSTQPSRIPSSCPSNVPSMIPSTQPSNRPSQQPMGRPSFVPSSQPLSTPTCIPSLQPSSRPTKQPSSFPSTQPSSQPTKNRFHCTVTDNKFYSPATDDCVPCPHHSFLNHTGDDTCYCRGGYSQVGKGLTVNCTVCSAGEVSLPGTSNCTQCLSGFFANSETNTCELCALSFYSSDSGQTQCTPCPAGRATATLGSTNLEQCISPVPNFTLGSLALFFVVVIFSWYIVFGKFQRVSFERKVKIVTPNIEKCKEVLLSEEEFHYQHLIVVHDKKSRGIRKFNFFFFVVLSIVLMILSVFLGFVFFTYQVFFTSLILWRGLKADLNLSPIFTLLAEGLKDITEYIRLPVNLFYFVALPFLYLFQTLAAIDLNLSSVNVTCAGSKAPIELLINCFILGLLVIVIRSDYQLLFNILLNNLNQRFLLNNIEQRLDSANFRFSRYFFICLVITALNTMNPFQVGLRYCMGFVRIDTFGKNHGIHEVTESCNQVPGAPNFDSFLGYTSTIFAWWLVLPAVYCLAEVVVPKCKKIDPLKWQISKEKHSMKSVKISPAAFFVDETVRKQKSSKLSPDDAEADDSEEENEENVTPEDEADQDVGVRSPEIPSHISEKFPGVDEADIYHECYKDRLDLENGRKQKAVVGSSTNTVDVVHSPSIFRNAVHKITKRMPFVLAFYYYCKQKYFLLISVDLWISNFFSTWITILKKNTLKASRKEELVFLSQGGNKPLRMTQFVSVKESPVKIPGVKQLFSLKSGDFIQGLHLYDLEQMKKQKKMDSLWEKERRRNDHGLPSYYELCSIARDELHEVILDPLAGILAFLGIGHFFTPTGRYYWKLVLNNYKIFLCVCFGIWTDEAVQAYGLEEKSINLSVDGRAFLYKNVDTTETFEEKKINANTSSNTKKERIEVPPLPQSLPSRRAQLFGVTVGNETSPNPKSAQNRGYFGVNLLASDFISDCSFLGVVRHCFDDVSFFSVVHL
jgi:hypothetical protein